MALPLDETRWTGKVPARSVTVGFSAMGEDSVEPLA